MSHYITVASALRMLAVVSAAIALFLLAPIQTSAGTFPGDNGKIVFASDRDGNREIYVMNEDGTGQTRLTTNSVFDGIPSWSPDGTKIAFASNRDAGDFEVYVMNADGTEQTRLTTSVGLDSEPTWSPDGAKIAFRSLRDGQDEIYVMNPDGSGQTNITNDSAFDTQPSYSPDGTKIVFRKGNEVYVMNADGTGQTNISNNAALDFHPVWSPDGGKIVFATNRDGNFEIYTMNADGTGATRLTTAAADDLEPTWSPDGTKISFETLRDGAEEIYVMNADGSGQTNITNNAASDRQPEWQTIPVEPPSTPGPIAFSSNRDGNFEIYTMNVDGSAQTSRTNDPANDSDSTWSPDGMNIAFRSNRDGNLEVYVMNADGTAQTNLSNNAALDYNPSWSPDGTQIAFVSSRDGNDEIYLMNSDGSNPVRLTNSAGTDFYPTWSSDGSQIAFASNRDSDHDIYVMNADGTGQTNITNNSVDDIYPAWSPDGEKIAFTSFRDGNSEIYTMLADGSGVVRLTTSSPTSDFHPSWSPDSSEIAFATDRDGNFEIYTMNADGSIPTRLTNNATTDFEPKWQPQEQQQEPVTLSAVTDSFLRQGNPDRNEGANPGLRIQASGDNRPVVAFDEAAIDDFVANGLTKATLVLTIESNADNWGQAGDRTVDAHALNVDFTEGNGQNAGVPASQSTRGTGPGVTWNCATDTAIENQQTNCGPQWSGGDFDPATAPSQLHVNGQTDEVEWDVTADVLAGAHAWLIKKTNENLSGHVDYYSKEGAEAAGNLSFAPRLILESGEASTIPSPVSYWKFDESSGSAADSTASGNTLMSVNGASFTPGFINNGANLVDASDQYFVIADSAQNGLDITGDMTINGWVNFASFVTHGGPNGFVSKCDNVSRAWCAGFFRDGVGDKLTFYVSPDGTSDNASNQQAVYFATPLQTGVWYMMTVVYDADVGTVSLYRDGVLQGTGTGLPDHIFNGTAEFRVGWNNRGSIEEPPPPSEDGFDGVMDEVGIWDQTLSESEIVALYNNGGAGLQYPF